MIQADDNDLIYSSYLYKRSKLTWHKYWVVLRNCQLSYYKDEKELRPLKVINQIDLQTFNWVNDKLIIYTMNNKTEFKCTNNVNKWNKAFKLFFNHKQYREEHEINHKLVVSHDHETFPALTTTTNKLATIHESTLTNSDKEYLIYKGFLSKKIHKRNNWMNFEIVLTNNHLYMYQLNSKLYKVIKSPDILDVIELEPSHGKWWLLLITKVKTIKFCAKDESTLINWLSVFKTVIMLYNS